jgi:hypothetical protein
MAKDMKGSELHALLRKILGLGAVIHRTSGYIVQGVTLKAQQASSHAAICWRMKAPAQRCDPGFFCGARPLFEKWLNEIPSPIIGIGGATYPSSDC